VKENGMLHTYLKRPLTQERYHSSLAGPHLDAFILWLEQRGYQSRRILRLMRGAHRFSQWAQDNGLGLEELNAKSLHRFRDDLQRQQPLRYPSGSHRPVILGARYLVTYFETLGLVPPTALVCPPPPEPELLGKFRQWMRTHRGTTEATLNTYRLPIIDLLHTLGEQPEDFEAKALRAFILEHAGRHGISQAKIRVQAIRMFLRFLIATGQCTPGLDHALPTIAHWRLASLPKYLPAETVEHVLVSCDQATPRGARDRAVLLLLARLGLRAGDVAALKWTDIDWHDGSFRVMGKNRRETRLPLPQEVGEAILYYGEYYRPDMPSPYVFLTTMAPIGPLSPKTVTKIAARALHRADVDSPIYGAHVFRHSAATTMLQQGVSLPSIGSLLRHASIETTTLYAKVDTSLLHSVVRVWPEVPSC
jgi:integrase/recombinase XerD